MDRQSEQQTLVERQITAYRGKLYAYQAQQFAERQGLTLAAYNRLTDTIYLSDGEPYTITHIVYDNAESLFLDNNKPDNLLFFSKKKER